MSAAIETSSKNELPGGDHFIDTRRGNEASQVFPLTGRPGVQVESHNGQQNPIKPASNNRPSESVSGMSLTGRDYTTKPVDFRSIEGSYAGDHRGDHSDTAAASLKQAANGQGGPRTSRGQFPNGRADTGGKGGAFGNEHSNQNFPEVTTDGD